LHETNESGRNLVPWQTVHTDNMIDRFDARAELDNIPEYQEHKKRPPAGSSSGPNADDDDDDDDDDDAHAAREKQLEGLLNYERYRSLVEAARYGVLLPDSSSGAGGGGAGDETATGTTGEDLHVERVQEAVRAKQQRLQDALSAVSSSHSAAAAAARGSGRGTDVGGGGGGGGGGDDDDDEEDDEDEDEAEQAEQAEAELLLDVATTAAPLSARAAATGEKGRRVNRDTGGEEEDKGDEDDEEEDVEDAEDQRHRTSGRRPTFLRLSEDRLDHAATSFGIASYSLVK
jgi:hypothetical protein